VTAPPDPLPLARRILLVTDAWAPQVNGVVRTLERLVVELRALGCQVEVNSPADGYPTIPLATYREIRLAVGARGDIEARFTRFAPDAVHIATEGPLGWEARSVCEARAYAERFSWRACAEDFRRNLAPLPPPQRRRLFARLRLMKRRPWLKAA
jgi:hypothetical protein